MRSNIVISAPVAGRKTQLFHLIFTEPGKVILVQPTVVQPCTSFKILGYIHPRSTVERNWSAHELLPGHWRRGARRRCMSKRPKWPSSISLRFLCAHGRGRLLSGILRRDTYMISAKILLREGSSQKSIKKRRLNQWLTSTPGIEVLGIFQKCSTQKESNSKNSFV